MGKGLSYKDAGVDVDAAGRFTAGIQALMRRTYGPRVIELDQGFAGLCSLRPDGLLGRRYREPVLSACTDGVGTKLKIAFLMDKHDTVGIDLVGMCVNDLVTVGAEPLCFLDYIATGKLEPAAKLVQIVRGISEGCVQANCPLLGGETAELPDFYSPGEYDLAGFAAGVVERRRIIDGRRIDSGDVLIGVASNGLHSNGFSLVRKVFFERAQTSVDEYVSELSCTLGEELLRPTRIYVRAIRAVLAYYKVKHIVHGIAHVTGGGLPDNIGRLLPGRCQARIKLGSWPVPPVFDLIAGKGGVAAEEMRRVFNMGIGMVLIVNPYNVNPILRILKRHKETAHIIGDVRRGKRGVVFQK